MAKSKQQEQTTRRPGRDAQTSHASRRRSRRPGAPIPQRPQPVPRIIYNDDLAIAICEHVADGKSLKEVCELDGMPSRTTAYKWLGENTSFANMYARAREERADLIADEIVTIADTDPDPNKARVRIDARKWWAAKVNPKKYGDKFVTENTNHNHSYLISDRPMSENEFEAAYCGADGASDGPARPH